jgi:hypothetical protein
MGEIVPIDSRDQAMIDTHLELTARSKSQRAWVFWIVVATVSVAAIYAATLDTLGDTLRLTLVIGGCIGFLLFIVFLSTKAIGSGYWNGPDIGWPWWWRP